MRKVLSVFIAACLVLSLFTGIFVSMPSARADTSGDYQYTLAGENATITRYTGGNGSVTIPSTLGGHRVTTIGVGAFSGCSFLTSVTIPDSVIAVGGQAFDSCSALTSVTIGSGVISIGRQAFHSCSKLTNIFVNGDNLNYASVDGVLYDKDITVLIQCPIRNVRTSFTIPNSVTAIGIEAFKSCLALTSVTIPDSVTAIGGQAFGFCSALTSVTIGSGVTTIANSAFQECSALTSVTIPNSVTSITPSAFEECKGLTSVSIGSGVTSIGDMAFYGCSGLTSVTIPNSVTSIRSHAFLYCSALTAAYFIGNAPTGTSSMFQSCAHGFTVHYISGTTGWTNPWYGYPTSTVNNTTKPPTVLVLHVGSTTFAMNGVSKTLDSPPVIKNGRTLVPIRAIIEALAGTVGWDATAKKATVTLGKKTIVLWIGKSAATVNGVSTLIDSTNTKVVPEIINGRTMLPLRFVTENLGATVGWDAATQTITITYAS